MEVDQITEALDRDHGARYAFRPVQGRAEKLFQALIGALAELSQEFSFESEIGPEDLGKRKDILPMRQRVEDFLGKFETPILPVTLSLLKDGHRLYQKTRPDPKVS